MAQTAIGRSNWVGHIHIMCSYETSAALLGPQKGPFWPRKALLGAPNLGPSTTGWSNWVDFIHIMCSGPNGLFGPNSFSFVALFWVEFYFWPNIGMWSVQSVPMERPAHTAIFQSIWNHPAEENGQNVNSGSWWGAHFAVCLRVCRF